MYCPRCGLEQPAAHRFCVRCGMVLPAELIPWKGPKLSRWFHSIPVHPADDPGAVLRVTRYLHEVRIETADGSVMVPAHHVRFSIWEGDRPSCVVSIPDDEAENLARFLTSVVSDGVTTSDEPSPR